MVGKYNRDTSSVTATPSTVTSSSAAFGRWAFGIGQPRRDRRGRTGIVKWRSVRSGGNVLTMLSCSASGIFAICCDLTQPTITRLARTFQSTRTRRRREQYTPLVAFCLRHFLADFIICMCECDFRQASGAGKRSVAEWPKLPRPSSTLPKLTSYGQKIETAHRRQRSHVCWAWAGVAQQACRGRLSRDDGGRKQFWVRRSAQQFQCSMAVLELLARATEAWVVAAGNEHLVNRSWRIVA